MATDYADIPTVTTLHSESERTQQAIDSLAAGGTMTNFTIGPPPPGSVTGTPPSTMMMSVSIMVTEPISPELVTALNGWLVNRQALIVAELAKYDVGPPPPPVTEPPVNVTAPVCEQSGSNLTCTIGAWNNTPSSYNYEWKNAAGVVVGGNAPTYPIAFADVGVSFSCTVTAINSIGTTIGPPSNSVVVVTPAM